jgi:outer membrane protein assembly factor BamA
MSFYKSLSCFVLIIMTFAIVSAQTRTIAKIEAEGLKQLSIDEVVATSGLRNGAPFSVADLDAAAQRLVDSGLFDRVGYRTTTRGNQITIIFQLVEKLNGQSPVVFDNFVWFTNDELTAAIKREVPSFNGTASDAGHMTDDIKRSLQNLLAEHHIAGNVEYSPEQLGINSSRQEHVFSVSGASIPICSLHFPGAKNVSEDELVSNSRQLTDESYSFKAAVAYSQYTLFPLYRSVGQLRAKFSPPIVKVDSSPKCKGGVDVTIAVEEGPIYLWDRSEWSGNKVMTPAELDAALAMKSGEVANGSKIDKGLREVSRRYGHTGHLDVSLRTTPEFDDAASRVVYKIEIAEGPQYRMGTFTVKGLSDAQAVSLQQKWKLKTGEVFDTFYTDQYIRKDAGEDLQQIIRARDARGQRPPEFAFDPHRETLTADVVLEFKN